ncbi:MAG: hypothetical protein U0132_16195 [Gemmatimonadaceae bacterium]
MTTSTPLWRALAFVLALVLPVGRIEAQPGLLSVVRTVSIAATKGSSISVSVVSGSSQTLTSIVDNTANNFPTPVRIQTSWDLPGGVPTVRLVAYFTNPAQALVNGTSVLSTARMKGRVLTTPITTWQPTTWTAFTQNSTRGVGVNGATLRLFRIPITAANQKASRTLDLELQLDLTGQAPINAGVWTGTVNVRAIAI